MKKIQSTLIRHKMSLIAWMLMLAVILIAIVLRFNVLEVSSIRTMALFNEWVKQHTFTLLLWHIFLIAAIYVYWGVKVSCLARQSHFSAENTKKIKSIRWVIIGAIGVIDLVVFYLR
jgi:hypothetical protein